MIIIIFYLEIDKKNIIVFDVITNKKVYLPIHSNDITHIVPCGEFMFSTGSKDKIIHQYNFKDFKIDYKYTIR